MTTVAVTPISHFVHRSRAAAIEAAQAAGFRVALNLATHDVHGRHELETRLDGEGRLWVWLQAGHGE